MERARRWCLIGMLCSAAAAHSVAEARSEELPPDEPRSSAKRQVEQLMNEGLRFAEKMLAEEGEFFPFGAVRVSGGPVRIVGAGGTSEQPEPDAVLEQLLSDLRQGAQRRDFVAIAVFANVTIPRPSDGEAVPAVFVGLEHLEGYCADVFFPYHLSEGRVDLDESFAAPRAGSVFGSCAGVEVEQTDGADASDPP